MKIFVKVKTSAKNVQIEQVGENNFAISVKEPPVSGKANKAVIKAVAEHFDIPLSRIEIISCHTSKQKIIEIS